MAECWPDWQGDQLIKVAGWPRPNDERIKGEFYLTGSRRSDCFAQVLVTNDTGADNGPKTAFSLCFAEPGVLYMLTRFATAGTAALKRLPHYVRFIMEPVFSTNPNPDAYRQEGFYWDGAAWQEAEEILLVAFQEGWTNDRRLNVFWEFPFATEWMQWNNVQPPAGVPEIVLPPAGPGSAFPWPPPPIPF